MGSLSYGQYYQGRLKKTSTGLVGRKRFWPSRPKIGRRCYVVSHLQRPLFLFLTCRKSAWGHLSAEIFKYQIKVPLSKVCKCWISSSKASFFVSWLSKVSIASYERKNIHILSDMSHTLWRKYKNSHFFTMRSISKQKYLDFLTLIITTWKKCRIVSAKDSFSHILWWKCRTFSLKNRIHWIS